MPPLLEPVTDSAVTALVKAVEAREASDARQASIDVARAGLDLKLRYRTAAETDLDLLGPVNCRASLPSGGLA